MKRFSRLAAALLAALLFVLPVSPALALRSVVYFVAADENVLPLTEETMPFWQNGALYVSTSIFTGVGKEALGLSRMQDENTGLVMVYQGTRKYLLFNPGENFCQDGAGNAYYPGAAQRNGGIFVPAQTVAKFFDMQFSQIEVEHGYLIWIRHADFNLPDSVFADAASFHLKNRYQEYVKSMEPTPTPEPVEITPVTPKEPAPSQPEPAAPARPEEPEKVPEDEKPEEKEEIPGGQKVYLCLGAGENTAAVLDALDRQGGYAAFFCTEEFAASQGDLLRRMTATGQGIALTVDAAQGEKSVTEQLEAANDALFRAACRKTRLALVQNADEAALREAREAGYCCVRWELDSPEPQSEAQAEELLREISRRGESVSVWLDGNGAGVERFLRAAAEVEDSCLALTETSFA